MKGAIITICCSIVCVLLFISEIRHVFKVIVLTLVTVRSKTVPITPKYDATVKSWTGKRYQLGTEVVSELQVDNSRGTKMLINIDFTMSNLPCNYFSVDAMGTGWNTF